MAEAALARPAAPPRVRELIETAGELIRLLLEETAALTAFKLARIGELAEPKRRLAEAYAGLVRGFRREPETLAAVTAAVRAELKDALERFDAAAAANERALAAARAANERVLKAVVEAAEARRGPAGVYSRAGVAAKPDPRRAAALSVAVDRRL